DWLDAPHFPPGFDLLRVEWERAAWTNAGDRRAEARAKQTLVRWRLYTLLANVSGQLPPFYEAALLRPDLPVTRAALGCALARAGDELASLIILCCNELDYTRQCLESVLQHTRPPYELVLVDNGSTDGTPAYLEEIQRRPGPQRVLVLRNADNRGFAAGTNQ